MLIIIRMNSESDGIFQMNVFLYLCIFQIFKFRTNMHIKLANLVA